MALRGLRVNQGGKPKQQRYASNIKKKQKKASNTKTISVKHGQTGYERQLPYAKWKKPRQVESLTFSTNSKGGLIKIGGFVYGDVYIGRLLFKGEMAKQKNRPEGIRGHRVAIKRRRLEQTRISDEKAAQYERCIRDLNKAGIWLPKMRMLKLKEGTWIGNGILNKDEWVQVSQLFGSVRQGSKINNKSSLNLKTKRERAEAVIKLTKVANAGYYPANDFVEPFTKSGIGVLPIDLDTIIKQSTPSVQKNAKKLSDTITRTIGKTHPREINRLFNLAIKTANNTLLKQAIRNTAEYRRFFR